MQALVNFDKPFLLETNAIKLGLGTVLCQKQTDSQYHPVAYASQSLTIYEHNCHSMKQEFHIPLRVYIPLRGSNTKVGNC